MIYSIIIILQILLFKNDKRLLIINKVYYAVDIKDMKPKLCESQKNNIKVKKIYNQKLTENKKDLKELLEYKIF